MSEPFVLYELSGNVARITLNRAAERNTISGEMLDQLSECLILADEDPEVRVIVLSGEGDFFCAGLDLNGSGTAQDIESGTFGPTINLRNAPPCVLHSIDKPTICALGSAAGYGFDIAICCDIRVMSEQAKLSAAFVRRGILPDSGGTWKLPRLLGWSKASELIFTGRTLNAEEALSYGLVSEVAQHDDLLERALSVAHEIASNAPLAVQGAKRMMRMGLDDQFNEHVHRIYLQLLPLFETADFQEGIAAFRDKRPAKFVGR